MNLGRVAIVALLACTVLAGAGMFYLQVWGYYHTLPPQTAYRAGDDVLAISGFEGIDSESSPLRYRACFNVTHPVDLPVAATPTPLTAPFWFWCFDAPAIDADITAGRARALVLEADSPWGFDRLMALYPNGRAFVWPQINPCGQAHFDGDRLPDGCTPPPSR